MQQMIQHVNEGAARATAQEWIARCRERSDPGSFFHGYAPLDPEAARAWVRQIIKTVALAHPLRMVDVCAMARAGWDEADYALRELIAEFADRQMPPALATYNMEIINPNRLPPHRLKGQKKSAHLLQDIFVATLVGELMYQHGLSPTRRQKAQPSACSVVSEALAEAGIRRIGEKSIERIWTRYWPAIRPTRTLLARHS